MSARWIPCVLVVAACTTENTSSSNPDAICTPGETRACTCFHDAGVGEQTCTDEGVAYTACGSCSPRMMVTGASSSAAPSSGSGSGGTQSSSSTGGDGCIARAKLIWVVDENHMLSSFDPSSLRFTDVGPMNCPSIPGASTFSMAVQRTAVAWVLYSSGELFRVDTGDATCVDTNYVPGQLGMELFGMGFVSDSPGSSMETLYIAGGPAAFTTDEDRALGSINLSDLSVTTTGTVHGSPELTGTGNAELHAFFPSEFAPRAARLDKISGDELDSWALASIAGVPQAWAYAFWGGSFWLFLKRDVDASTVVYRLHVSSGNPVLTTAIADTGRKIVGAGVSTCAPVR